MFLSTGLVVVVAESSSLRSLLRCSNERLTSTSLTSWCRFEAGRHLYSDADHGQQKRFCVSQFPHYEFHGSTVPWLLTHITNGSIQNLRITGKGDRHVPRPLTHINAVDHQRMSFK